MSASAALLSDDRSLAQQLSMLPPEDMEAALEGMDVPSMMHDWLFWGRPSQIFAPPYVPEEMWIGLYVAGRGTGKTRSGAEFADHKAISMPGSRGIIVARTAADTRDVMVEGESGILNIGDPSTRPHYEPSKRRLTWKNGSMATLFTAEEPDVLRGPQGHWAVCDELATWTSTPDSSGLTAWDNVRIATRLGKFPQILALTTPKRTAMMKQVMELAETHDNVILRRGRTADNLGNLSSAYLDVVYGLYGGTRLAKQELEGEMLEDVEGALWNMGQLNQHRITHIDGLPRVPMIYIVAVDPSVAENPTDECGIIVCACTVENDLYKRQFYVIEDATVYGSPNVWASKVVEKANEYGAPVVAETNQGGALVRNALVNIDPNIKVYDVRARYGKLTRAEPVALAFEQGRGHMYGEHPDLESQLISWTPSDRKSPDRLDAMVWGATALLIQPPPGLWTSTVRAHSVARMRFSAPPLPASSLSPHTMAQFPYLAGRGFSVPGRFGPPGYPGATRGRRNRAYNRKLPKFRITLPR
jgi:phage terminase large subunit-like protein